MQTAMLENLSRMIDISGVRADVTYGELERIVAAAKHYRFVCVFAMPCFTKRMVEALAGEPDIAVGGAVGFPSGAETSSTKVAITRELVSMGVDELDMVINIGALKSGDLQYVYDDIRAFVDAASGKITKCILEVAHLDNDEIRRGAETAVRAGVGYIKTGTGWANKPTTVEAVRLIRVAIGDAAKIKAAGGIRTLDSILQMVNAGCSRFGIGLNSVIAIMKEADMRLGRLDDFSLDQPS